MLMIGRREFIAGLGGAAAWPLAVRAQQRALPLVGIVDMVEGGTSFRQTGSVGPMRQQAFSAFRRGLNETGYIEGRNVAIEYHTVGLQFDRVSGLATDLLRRRVAVIFAIGPLVVRQIRAQSMTIPIVFFVGEDPVKEGLVASLNRPGGNTTGTTNFTNQLFAKRLQLLREVVPKAKVFAFLVDPNNSNAEPDAEDVQAAATVLGVELRVLTARNEAELEVAFAVMDEQRIGGLLTGLAGFGVGLEKLAALVARHAIPTMSPFGRAWPAAGGLMSYDTSTPDAWHIGGTYVGRILKGEKPADLPVQQSTEFEFIVNLKTAKTLGLEIPPGLLAFANEVIE
jgi:putative tryptophan/tyrosine transport system substrate-binding protein